MKPRSVPARLLLGAVASALVLAGCSTDSEPESPEAAESTAYPVTVNTAFGSAEIPSEPTRVAVLDLQSLDIVLSLGVEPIASSTIDVDRAPWFADHPVLDVNRDDFYSADYKLSVEAVAASQPDLIIADSWVVADQAGFNSLSEIAPVISSTETGSVGWRERAVPIAEALNKTAELEQLIADADAAAEQAREDFPALVGKTYQYTAFGTRRGGFWWGNGVWLEHFGLVPHDAQDNTQLGEGFALENLDTLAADIVVIWPFPLDEQAILEGDARFQRLPAATANGILFINDQIATATNTAGPRSLEYAYSEIRPFFEAYQAEHG